MSGQSIAAALSSMEAASKAAAIISGNIANSDTDGYKSFKDTCYNIVNTAADSAGGVSSTSRMHIDMQGNVRRTNVATDIALDGNGFFTVTEKVPQYGAERSVLFTKTGSFRKDKEGNFALPSGHLLMAWAVSPDGRLPETKSIVDSLSVVNVQKILSEASSTTKVDVALNLDSKQDTVGGGEITFNMINSGTKASPYNAFAKSDDIIYPNTDNSLTPGEGIAFRIEDDMQYFIYGGFAETLSFPNAGTALTTATLGNLAADEFSISIGSTTHLPFTRGTGVTNLEVMQNIVDQINGTTGAQQAIARLINDGTNTTILVAPKNANYAMTFSGINNLRMSIGLTDTKNTQTASNRFASLTNLRDLLVKVGIKATVSSDNNAQLTLRSDKSMFISNHQPLAKSSDFISEFNISNGYVASSYDPYDSNNNMAGGKFVPHFSRDFMVYDSMGNSYNFLISFLKVDANKWATEVYVIDSSVVDIPGRVDGLLQAGNVSFDGLGNLESLSSAAQIATSKDISSPDIALGATNGQTIAVQVKTTTNLFTYHDTLALGSSIAAAGTVVSSAGAATDTLIINVGTTTHTFTRGTGTNDLDILNNIITQVNKTEGVNALRAKLKDLGGSNYRIEVYPVDVTKNMTITDDILGIAIGITSADNIGTDPSRFKTLYELAERINETKFNPVNLNPIKAKIIPGSIEGTFKIKIEPVTNTLFMTFSGSSAAIAAPLGNGLVTTIADALELENTSEQKQLASLENEVTVKWSEAIKAIPNKMQFNWGRVNSLEGLSQVSQNYTVKKIEQNGVSTGELTTVQVDKDGYVIANFSNSKSRKIFKLAIADFSNPNGLLSLSGNVFAASKDSGPLNLKEATVDGAGKVVSGSIEGSNVDISDELARLIQVQRRFQASAKVINVEDKLNEELIHRTYA